MEKQINWRLYINAPQFLFNYIPNAETHLPTTEKPSTARRKQYTDDRWKNTQNRMASLVDKLPDVLVEHVLEFVRGDFKTLSRFLQTRKSIRNKYNYNLVVLKCLWLDIQNIRGIDLSMKEQLYKAYFYTTSRYRNIGAEGARHLAEALKVNKTLKKIDLQLQVVKIGDEGIQLLQDAWKEAGKPEGGLIW